MANGTLATAAVYPDGTSVSAYLRRDIPDGHTGSPPAAPVNTQTVAGGSVTFTGLAKGESYVAAGLVSGTWRYRAFAIDPDPVETVAEHAARETNVHGILSTADLLEDTTIDAKGDLLAAPAADQIDRLPVGADDEVLTADSGETLGLKWGPPPSADVAVIKEAPLNVKYPEFGALGDNSGDQGPAIQAALDLARHAVPANLTEGRGGEIYVPGGEYRIVTPLNMDTSYWGISAFGDGIQNYYWGDAVTQLSYVGGAAALPLLRCRSGHHNRFRGIGFQCKDSAFDGDLVDAGSTGADGHSTQFDFCDFTNRGGGSLGGALSARSGLRFDRQINGLIRSCHFYGYDYNLILGDGGYSIRNVVDDCVFNGAKSRHIWCRTGSNEALGLTNNTFEPLADGSAGALLVDPAIFLRGVNIEGNWFGDISADGGYHIEGRWRGGHIAGNRIYWGGTDSPAVMFNGVTIGTFVGGNMIETDVGFDSSAGAGEIQGFVIGGNSNPSGDLIVDRSKFSGLVELLRGAFGAGVVVAGTTMPPHVTGDLITMGRATSAPAGRVGSVIWHDPASSPGTLNLQPATDTDGHSNGKLWAGATPAVRFQWNANGVAFNGGTPGKPTITGSRGGNAALADLLTRLATLGLITDSTSA